MDPHRFDTLVHTLSTASSRRRLLGILSALPLVGTALPLVPEETAAKGNAKTRGTRKTRRSGDSTHQVTEGTSSAAQSCVTQCRKKSSKRARRKCRKRCTPPTPECTTTQDCPGGELCESGVCIPIPELCVREGEQVSPGQACCAGLAEDAAGRCEPVQLTECCLTQARGYGNCPSCSVGDAAVTCVPKGTCTGQAVVGSTSFPTAGTFGAACDAGMASICVEIERCCVGPDGGLIGCALPSYGDGTCSGNFRVPIGGLSCPAECSGA